MNHGVFKEKNGNSAFCTKIWSRGGGQDAQNETCARLSRSNQNENLDKLARSRLACSKRVCKFVCLVGFLAFFGLFLNSQNNLFAFEAKPLATLSIDPNGGIWENGETDVIEIEKLVDDWVESSEVPNLTNAGFEFGGWFEGEKEYKFPMQMPDGETRLTAKWNLIQYKIVEFNLKKSFASGGPQFFAAIGTAAGKQSPSQSIPEFLKSNVAEKMFVVTRAASATAEDETQLTRKNGALEKKEADLNYYTIENVTYDSENNSFTVTFNVVVLVSDESGEIRLRESATFAPGLFTVKYDNSTKNYCALPYANLKNPSGGDQT